MKMKRFISGLLSLVMMAGMLGTVDVNAAESAYGTEVASNLTSGTFTDDNADVNEDYVYTIVGSDGSVAEISTDAYDDIAEAYWKLEWNRGSFNSDTVRNGTYLIVGARVGYIDNKAIKAEEACIYGPVSPNGNYIALSDDLKAYEWAINKNSNGSYQIKVANSESPLYMTIKKPSSPGAADSPAVTVETGETSFAIRVTSPFSGYADSDTIYANTVFIGDFANHTSGYLNANGTTYAGTWNGGCDLGSCYYLYKKGYRVSSEALQKVLDEVVGTEWDYSIDTWNAYNNALAEVYSVCDTPNEALAEFEALVEAKDALEVAKTKAVYEKLEGVIEPEEGNYLIVMQRNRNSKGAVANVPVAGFNFSVDKLEFIVNGKTTKPVEKKYVWTVAKKGTGYTIGDQTGKYVDITGNGMTGASLVADKAELKIVWLGENLYEIGKGSNYLNVFNDRGEQLGTYDVAGDAGNKLYLYKEKVYVTDLSIVMATKNVGEADFYTSVSWNEYQEALNEAKVEFKTKEEAEEALENLTEKKEALKSTEVESVYKKLSEGAAVDTGKYLIVTADRNKDSALANHRASGGNQFAVVKPVYSADGTVRNIESKYVWLITKKVDNSGYTIQDAENKYLYIKENNSDAGLGLVAPENVGSIASNNVIIQIPTPNSTGRLVIGNGSQYLHCYNHTDFGLGTYQDKNDTASNFYLYKENFAAKTELLAELEIAVGSEDLYTTATWNVYTTALAVVKKSSATKVEAEKALEDLRAAVKALKKVDYSVLNVTFDRYQIDDSKTPLVEDGIYAIVGAHYDGGRQSQNKVIKNGGGFMYEDLGNGPGTAGPANVYDSIPEDKLANSIVYEWEFKSTSETQNSYHVKSVQMGTYMQIRANVTLQSNPSVITIRRDDNVKGNTTTYRNLGGIILGNDMNNNVLNHRGNAVGIWTYQESANNNHGNTYYLYKKQYRVNTTALEAQVDPNGVYDATAKAAYDTALAVAKAAVGKASVVYEKYLALEEATKNLIATMTEGIIPATVQTVANGWTKNTASMDAKLTLGGSALVKTDKPLAFDLMDASAFELLATCGNDTGMVMAVVKDANGKTLRSYLVDTYYATETPEVNVPIVRDMKLKGGETVDVYACLVESVVDKRVGTMSAMGRAVEVTTDDIVMALLEELGLENELDVADVNVSYMSEDSVLKGGTSSSIHTYAVAPMTTETTGDNTEYTVSVQGCRIYKAANGVEYKALSDLVADGKIAFISKNATEFVLSDYQKTGPQNEIYLDNGESIVLGLADKVSGEVAIRVRTVNSPTDDGAYRTLTFEPVEGQGYQATITNDGTERIALGMIKVSGGASASFIMTDEIAKAVVAAMNAESTPTETPEETPEEVINPFADVKEGDYFYDAVLWAVEENVTTGVSETSFAPWEECTRGQVVTFLWRAAGSPKSEDTEITFKDVVAGEYYEDAVRWAVKEGITTGYSEEVFAPYDKCTRAQVVTFLWRAAGKPSTENVKNPFADVVVGEYYEDAVQWAVQNGITTGVDPEHFAPNDTCLRGQTVTFLYRVSK